MWLAACFLIASPAFGQADFNPNLIEHDLQFFSPVDFDFEFQPLRKESGLFFKYDKLSWAITGDRTTIGNPNVQVLSEIIYDGSNTFDEGAPPPRYIIQNGLQDVVPNAEFGWGERYEFGTVDERGNTWTVGILDGPEVNQSVVFGSGPQTSGFGSIHINFATPPGYLLGFRDYFNNANDTAGVVINGPGGVGSGVPDDIDGDLGEGIFTFFIDANLNGMLDPGEEIAVAEDFEDLHEFNIRFNQLNVRNTTELQGVELMRTVQLDNNHKMKKRQGSTAEIGYGVRFLRLRDEFSFNGTSDLFRGLNFVNTASENQIVGPQIRGKWATQNGRWNFAVDSRFVFGYNIQDNDQQGTWGENLLTGGLNQPAIAQPTTFSSGRRENDFSPLVELRVNSSYQLTTSIAMQLGYTAMFIDNISRASQLVQYNLPDWGISEGGQQDIFINGVNFGFDVVY